eukprot:g19641.t1
MASTAKRRLLLKDKDDQTHKRGGGRVEDAGTPDNVNGDGDVVVGEQDPFFSSEFSDRFLFLAGAGENPATPTSNKLHKDYSNYSYDSNKAHAHRQQLSQQQQHRLPGGALLHKGTLQLDLMFPGATQNMENMLHFRAPAALGGGSKNYNSTLSPSPKRVRNQPSAGGPPNALRKCSLSPATSTVGKVFNAAAQGAAGGGEQLVLTASPLNDLLETTALDAALTYEQVNYQRYVPQYGPPLLKGAARHGATTLYQPRGGAGAGDEDAAEENRFMDTVARLSLDDMVTREEIQKIRREIEGKRDWLLLSETATTVGKMNYAQVGKAKS